MLRWWTKRGREEKSASTGAGGELSPADELAFLRARPDFDADEMSTVRAQPDAGGAAGAQLDAPEPCAEPPEAGQPWQAPEPDRAVAAAEVEPADLSAEDRLLGALVSDLLAGGEGPAGAAGSADAAGAESAEDFLDLALTRAEAAGLLPLRIDPGAAGGADSLSGTNRAVTQTVSTG